jgi:hypothetical protein
MDSWKRIRKRIKMITAKRDIGVSPDLIDEMYTLKKRRLLHVGKV